MYKVSYIPMGSLFLLTLVIALMFSSGYCYSESMACSVINGQMICEKQKSDGNTAGAVSGAFAGPNGGFQDAAAMAGDSMSRTSVDAPSYPVPGFGPPSLPTNNNAIGMRGFGHIIGTGASDVTSFPSNNGDGGISRSGFSGTSNNHGIPRLSFGGFAVADPTGNMYGGGNAFSGGYVPGNGNAPGYGIAPNYGYAPGYDSAPGYGNAPAYGTALGYGHAPAFGNFPGSRNVPAYDNAPGYGNVPAYGNAPGYGNVPAYGNAPGYGNVPAYGNAPIYGNNPFDAVKGVMAGSGMSGFPFSFVFGRKR